MLASPSEFCYLRHCPEVIRRVTRTKKISCRCRCFLIFIFKQQCCPAHAECLNAVSRCSRGACDRSVDDTYLEQSCSYSIERTLDYHRLCCTPSRNCAHSRLLSRLVSCSRHRAQTADSCRNIVIILNFARERTVCFST